MGREIERKFLVTGDGWREAAESSLGIRQAYLAVTDHLSIRLRLRDDGQAFLTLKSAAKEISRAEYEYPVPLSQAEEMLLLAASPILEKRRHHVMLDGVLWEVDVFAGRHAGLVLAEVELSHPDQPLALPDWLGAEVTGDPRFYNETLARGG
ncbi:MAG: adenylate cyclase [Mesorhizobium amorphae]|nr:MAG: adenylate cyclase [Mesorhizobium amorphae]